MENHEIKKAFLGISVPLNKVEIPNSISVDLSAVTGPEKVAHMPSQGPFRATLRGSLTVKSEAKLLKVINNFEKRVIKSDKFTGENKNIDELVAKWFGTSVGVESLDKGVQILFDSEIELPGMFSALMANFATEAEGTIQYLGQDKKSAIYRMKDGKLTSETV